MRPLCCIAAQQAIEVKHMQSGVCGEPKLAHGTYLHKAGAANPTQNLSDLLIGESHTIQDVQVAHSLARAQRICQPERGALLHTPITIFGCNA